VVLKFDLNVLHHGGLGVIRSLGRMGVAVYGVHEGPWAPAARFPLLDVVILARTLAALITRRPEGE